MVESTARPLGENREEGSDNYTKYKMKKRPIRDGIRLTGGNVALVSIGLPLYTGGKALDSGRTVIDGGRAAFDNAVADHVTPRLEGGLAPVVDIFRTKENLYKLGEEYSFDQYSSIYDRVMSAPGVASAYERRITPIDNPEIDLSGLDESVYRMEVYAEPSKIASKITRYRESINPDGSRKKLPLVRFTDVEKKAQRVEWEDTTAIIARDLRTRQITGTALLERDGDHTARLTVDGREDARRALVQDALGIGEQMRLKMVTLCNGKDNGGNLPEVREIAERKSSEKRDIPWLLQKSVDTEEGREIVYTYDETVRLKRDCLVVEDVYPAMIYEQIAGMLKSESENGKVSVTYIRGITTATSRNKDKTLPVTSQFFITYYPNGIPDEQTADIAEYYDSFSPEDMLNRFGSIQLGEPVKAIKRMMGQEESAVLVARDMNSFDVLGTSVIMTDASGNNGDFGFDIREDVRKTGLGDVLRRDSLGFAERRGLNKVFFEIYTRNSNSIKSQRRLYDQPSVPWGVEMGKPMYGEIDGFFMLNEQTAI